MDQNCISSDVTCSRNLLGLVRIPGSSSNSCSLRSSLVFSSLQCPSVLDGQRRRMGWGPLPWPEPGLQGRYPWREAAGRETQSCQTPSCCWSRTIHCCVQAVGVYRDRQIYVRYVTVLWLWWYKEIYRYVKNTCPGSGGIQRYTDIYQIRYCIQAVGV